MAAPQKRTHIFWREGGETGSRETSRRSSGISGTVFSEKMNDEWMRDEIKMNGNDGNEEKWKNIGSL